MIKNKRPSGNSLFLPMEDYFHTDLYTFVFMGNYNIQCDIAMNDQKDERSVTVRELGCGVGPKS